ncbi:MAG: RNA methyltransferase [Chloroflexi bacterium]|nr:RNA methyltransferase [Chloroflexota bacterium]
MDVITSLSNPLVKQIRALRQKKARARSGTFLVEGIHHVGEAIEAGWEAQTVVHAPELLSSTFGKKLLHQASGSNIHVQSVSALVMESLADKENPQGLLAVFRQRKFHFSDLRSVKRAVALVAPQDPGNVGAILRTMDAVKADALFVLDGGVELFHPGVVRSSMGSLFWKPVVQCNFGEFHQWAREGGYQMIGSSAHGEVDYRTLVPRIPWVLVLGSEQKGLTKQQAAALDVVVSLPMQGRVSSLNLAVAAGILLYQFS